MLVSDSGGVQEETTVLGRPLVVVRRSTERPEAMESGFAELVAPGRAIGRAVRRRLAEGEVGLRRLTDAPSPFGDGLASQRIVALLGAVALGRRPEQGQLSVAA